MTEAVTVILIGAGEGCYGLEHLIRSRGMFVRSFNLIVDIADTVKGIVNFFGDVEPKSIGENDEDRIYWYMKVLFPYEQPLIEEFTSLHRTSQPHPAT